MVIQTEATIKINITDVNLSTEKIYDALLNKIFGADSPLMKQIAEYLLDVVQQRFEQQGYEEPGDWGVPSGWTMLRRISEGRYPAPGDELNKEHWKSLIDTEVLKGSFEYIIEDGRIVVGTNVPYARKQQEGGDSTFPAFVSHLIDVSLPGNDPFYQRFVDPRRGDSENVYHSEKAFGEKSIDIKSRPMVGFTEENIKEIKEIIISYIRGR